MRKSLLVTVFLSAISIGMQAFAGPSFTTYQARIVKPDGYPLEDSNVNFRFSILTPAGSCVLYSEIYSSVNMNSSGGYVTFSLGSGTKIFPVDSTSFKDVLSNAAPTLNCAAGGAPFYIPSATDTRKLVMQFQHRNGWQTVPAMIMNAIPYAMYADSANTLNGKTEAEFVFKTAIPTCVGDERLFYNGVSFVCTIANAASGTVSVSTVSTALGFTPVSPASFTTVTNSLSSDINSVSNNLTALNSQFSSVSATVITLNNSVSELFQTTLVTSGATYTKVTVDGRGRVMSGANISALDISTALGFAPVASTSFTSITNSLSNDITNVTNSVSTLNSQLSAVSTTVNGLGLSVSELFQPTSVTSGATYTKVNVDGRGRVMSGANISALDISTALGFSPVAPTSFTSVTNSLSNDITNVTNSVSTLNSQLSAVSTTVNGLGLSVSELFQPTSVTSGATYTKVTVDGRGRVITGTSFSASDVVAALGYSPLATLNLGSASATGTLAAARLPAFFGDVSSVSGSANLILTNSGVTSGSYNQVIVDSKGRVTSGTNVSITSSRWSASGSSISYSSGSVGIGTQNPQATLDVSGSIRVGVTAASCSSANEGAQRYNSTLKEMEFCNGTSWNSFGGSSTIPTGAIMAFDLTTCPTGWTEYTAARGRFLRGIDNGAGNDPSGTRAPGNVQTDDFKSHSHTPNGYFVSGQSGADGDLDGSTTVTGYDKSTMTGSLSSTGGTETRPKNVAVLYCRKN